VEVRDLVQALNDVLLVLAFGLELGDPDVAFSKAILQVPRVKVSSLEFASYSTKFLVDGVYLLSNVSLRR